MSRSEAIADMSSHCFRSLFQGCSTCRPRSWAPLRTGSTTWRPGCRDEEAGERCVLPTFILPTHPMADAVLLPFVVFFPTRSLCADLLHLQLHRLPIPPAPHLVPNTRHPSLFPHLRVRPHPSQTNCFQAHHLRTHPQRHGGCHSPLDRRSARERSRLQLVLVLFCTRRGRG